MAQLPTPVQLHVLNRGWAPRYDLETMVEDMQKNLSRKLAS